MLYRGSKRAQIAHILTGLSLVAIVVSGVILGTTDVKLHLSHPSDKVAHFAGFAAFTFLFGRFFHAYVVAAILVLFAGSAMEVIQIFLPGRSFSVADILANCSGAVFVLILRWIMDGAGMSLAYFLPKRYAARFSNHALASQ